MWRETWWAHLWRVSRAELRICWCGTDVKYTRRFTTTTKKTKFMIICGPHSAETLYHYHRHYMIMALNIVNRKRLLRERERDSERYYLIPGETLNCHNHNNNPEHRWQTPVYLHLQRRRNREKSEFIHSRTRDTKYFAISGNALLIEIFLFSFPALSLLHSKIWISQNCESWTIRLCNRLDVRLSAPKNTDRPTMAMPTNTNQKCM